MSRSASVPLRMHRPAWGDDGMASVDCAISAACQGGEPGDLPLAPGERGVDHEHQRDAGKRQDDVRKGLHRAHRAPSGRSGVSRQPSAVVQASPAIDRGLAPSRVSPS